MAEGFYVSIKRDLRYGLLLGPYDSKTDAENHVDLARKIIHDLRKAGRVDPFTVFDGYGVTRLVTKQGCKLPQGKLTQYVTVPTSTENH